MRRVPTSPIRSPLLRMLTSLLIFLALAIVAVGVLLMLYQDRLMYFPSRYTNQEKAMAEAVGLRRLEFATDEGRQTAFYLPPAGERPGTELGRAPAQLWIAHCGNGSRVLDLLGVFTDLPDEREVRRGVLLVDYPGYGDSLGKPSPASILAAGQGALGSLWERGGWKGDPVRAPAETGVSLNFLGHSLGSAATLQLAASLRHADSVLLLSPFTSMREMANQRVSPLFSWLLRHKYDNRNALATLLKAAPARVTLVHGVRDSSIPVTMSRRLAADHQGIVQLVELPEADHNDFVYDELPLLQRLITSPVEAPQPIPAASVTP